MVLTHDEQRSPAACARMFSASATSPMTGAPALAARTMIAMPAPSAMLRSRPVTMLWRSQSRIRDSQRSMTPMAPDVVHSIAASAMASSTGELSRVPSTRCAMSRVHGVGQEAVEAVGDADRRVGVREQQRLERGEPQRHGASESTQVVGQRRDVVGDPRPPVEVERPAGSVRTGRPRYALPPRPARAPGASSEPSSRTYGGYPASTRSRSR